MPPYIGRFAPSPTGPLHFGSLVAALASYLDAKAAGGTWLVRIEDLDPPREIIGSSQRILEQLALHGMNSDGPVRYQSQRLSQYEAQLEQLIADNHVYRCRCARRSFGSIYPGRCRTAQVSADEAHALRLRINTSVIQHHDIGMGAHTWRQNIDYGDFILKRKDGLFAYQLAVVIDDIDQGITRIVRGADLLASTAMQYCLYKAFNTRSPDTLHVPIMRDRDGQKLSKQNHAPELNDLTPAENLQQALQALNQSPISIDSPENMLTAAIDGWQPSRIWSS